MKKIVIVGATSGIGERVAEIFAAMGWKVAIAGRREERLKEIAAKYPDNMIYKTIDVVAQDAVTRFNDLIEEDDGMDVLLFASGVGFANPTLEPAKDKEIIDVNVYGFTKIVNAAFDYFNATANLSKGRIAAITSVAGTKGLGLAATYSASKRYQQNYLQALDQLAHIRHINVGITDIRPGFVRTALLDPDKAYPMTMAVPYAAERIVKAILHGCRVATIDWKWNVVTGLWRLIPNCLWSKLEISY